MSFFKILIGAGLLGFGRKLYWLFVGALGFAAASSLMLQYARGMNEWLALLIALAVGIVGALLAIWAQAFAVGMAGFLGGGQIALSLLHLIGLRPHREVWIVFFIGGILGVLLIIALFDWALILISSFGGASLLTEAFHLQPSLGGPVFLALAIIGIAIQARQMRQE